MLFRRRKNLPIWQKIAGWLWPRSGLKRAWTYLFHRIGRMPGSTHSIAAGIACGAAVSFTPFLGLHFLMAFILAWIVRGNLFAAAMGTFVGNPWTFPLIFALTGQVGAFLLGREVIADVPSFDWDAMWLHPIAYFSDYFSALLPIVFPFLVGGIPAAILVWLLFYISFRSLISGYRESRDRRRKLREKARAGTNEKN